MGTHALHLCFQWSPPNRSVYKGQPHLAGITLLKSKLFEKINYCYYMHSTCHILPTEMCIKYISCDSQGRKDWCWPPLVTSPFLQPFAELCKALMKTYSRPLSDLRKTSTWALGYLPQILSTLTCEIDAVFQLLAISSV